MPAGVAHPDVHPGVGCGRPDRDDRPGPPRAAGRFGQAPLGAPVDQHKAGWYAAGPKPWSGMGTVLTNGHTYRDGSAIFQQDFAALVAVGQRIDLVLDNGTTCSYRISTVWRNVDAVQDYPQLVASERLYDQQGPERPFCNVRRPLDRKCPDVQGHPYRRGHPSAQLSLTARLLGTLSPTPRGSPALRHSECARRAEASRTSSGATTLR